MIQRIQSIFLFFGAACAFGLLGLPFASINGTSSTSKLFEDGLYSIYDHPVLFGLFVAAGALSLIALFLFKSRNTQSKIVRFALIANIIGMILSVILFFNDQETIADKEVQDGLGVYLPVLCIVLLFFALRYINKDQKIVSSMDRLR